MSDYLSIANSPIMWLSCFPLVLLVLCQAVLYTRRAFATAVKMGISKSDCVKAFRAGMISAIGPSVAVFIMMVGLMSAVGSPVSWMRLSVMGAAAGEMINAGLGAQAVGSALGAADFGIRAYAAALWGMSLFSVAWIVVLVFIPQMNKVQVKVEKYDKNLMTLISTASMLGIMSYMTMENCLTGLPMIVACVSASLCMVGLSRTVKKLPWLREYHMGIAMIVGIVCAPVCAWLIGG
ncbi:MULTISPECIES: DUF5058 family protein [Anaerotruncus]|uniref:DUF5058 family protein n=2 Tax=Anaerotruncus TaxID=244127 RepID=A0A498CLU3_9FIRM|nr:MULTISPECIES: DUF5058 family protein [Anaerotruncus]MBC3938835.1 DUF5058 family protein [Anaerotruncus massiliensis (ex Togo et al. 2019)]MCQ4897147.1 DUF5058 family protein [Anaerotruncus sp. DFI.9.16]RLL10959.1 DUF5058 family protein [Anaerotruncus massiliensis (ex Liu et al. 2021)]GKH46418.1 DUF5058 domain-containing protein [Oscillospiraceae bacterium]